MIERLIDDDNVTRIIIIDSNNKFGINKNSDNMRKNDIAYYDNYVNFSPNYNPEIPTIDALGYVSLSERPSYVGLAHELIHADRANRGVTLSGYESFTYMIANIIFTSRLSARLLIEFVTKSVPKEELATVGLICPGEDDITENMIREEHGLYPRGGYSWK